MCQSFQINGGLKGFESLGKITWREIMLSIQGEKKKKEKEKMNDSKKQGIIKHLKLIIEILKRVVGDLYTIFDK